jgi:hypothetical protein
MACSVKQCDDQFASHVTLTITFEDMTIDIYGVFLCKMHLDKAVKGFSPKITTTDPQIIERLPKPPKKKRWWNADS